MIAKSTKTWHVHDMHSWHPFKKGSRVERGENMHTRDTLTRRVLESKGVKCIEERPSLVGHNSKGVIKGGYGYEN